MSFTFLGFIETRDFLLTITKIFLITPITYYSNFLTFGFLVIMFWLILLIILLFLCYYIYVINKTETFDSIVITKTLIFYFSFQQIFILPIMFLVINTIKCNTIKENFASENIICYKGPHLALFIFSILLFLKLVFLCYLQVHFIFNFSLNTHSTNNYTKPVFLKYLVVFKMFLSITVEEFKGLLDKTNFIISSLIIIYTIILFTKVKNYHTFIDKKTYNSYLTLGIIILYAAFLMFVDHLLFILKLEQFQVYFELLLLGSVFITIIIVYKLNEDIKILSVKLSNATSQDEALYKILFLQKLIIQNNLHKRNKVLLQGYILDHELDCKITDCNLGKYKNKVLFKNISHNYSVANNIFNKKKSTNTIVSKFNNKTQSIKSLKSNKSINKSDRRSKNLKKDFLDKLMSNSEKSNLSDSNSGSKSLGSYNYQNENNDSSDCSVETNLKLLNEDEKNYSDGENDLEVDDFQESLLANKQKCFENSSESLQFLFLHIEKEFERYSQKFSDNFYLRFFYCQLLVYEFYNYNKALRILKDLENKCVDLTEEFMVYTLKQRILNFQNELNLYLEMELNQDKNKDEILSNIKFVNLANEYKSKLEKVGEQLIDFWENFKGTSGKYKLA